MTIGARRAHQQPCHDHRPFWRRQGAGRARAPCGFCRKNGHFVSLNAATITPERMEIELFGTESNGAPSARSARWKRPSRHPLSGTRVADMPKETQAKDPARLGRAAVRARRRRQARQVDVRFISSPRRTRGVDRAGQVPRGPLPPPRRRADHGAGSRRAPRGHSLSRRRFIKQIAPPVWHQGPPRQRRRHGGPPGAQMAGQTCASCATSSSVS